MNAKPSPATRPWDVEVIRDMFGFNLHLEGRVFHIPYNQLIPTIKALCCYAEPASVPALLVELGKLIGEAELRSLFSDSRAGE